MLFSQFTTYSTYSTVKQGQKGKKILRFHPKKNPSKMLKTPMKQKKDITTVQQQSTANDFSTVQY
jgi:hypothetical protein